MSLEKGGGTMFNLVYSIQLPPSFNDGSYRRGQAIDIPHLFTINAAVVEFNSPLIPLSWNYLGKLLKVESYNNFEGITEDRTLYFHNPNLIVFDNSEPYRLRINPVKWLKTGMLNVYESDTEVVKSSPLDLTIKLEEITEEIRQVASSRNQGMDVNLM